MSIIELKNVTKRFETGTGEDFTAVKDISLSIEEGEFITILGPSGCGKSTILEIISGLLTNYEGQVLLEGKNLKDTDPKIGVVFQDSSLFPWRTVEKNIEIGLECRNVDKDIRKKLVEEYIEKVNLKGFEDKYPHQLSGGMKQRVGLARTMVNSPDIILMDEPLSAVDYLTRLSIQDEIVELWQKEKKTIIFITHDVSEAVYLGTKVVLLSPSPGRIKRIFDVPLSRPRSRDDDPILHTISEIYKELSTEEKEPGNEKIDFYI